MRLTKNSYTDSVEKLLAKVGVALPGLGLYLELNTGEYLADAEDGLTTVGYSIGDAYRTCLRLYGTKTTGFTTEQIDG